MDQSDLAASRLAAILPNINAENVRGPLESGISRIVYDSRKAGPATAFVAICGIHVNGHDFIAQAIENGCRVVVHTEPLRVYRPDVAYIKVPDARVAMSALASALSGDPSRRIPVVGVTGTDGKSSTVYFLHQLLEMLGYESGFLSTVAMKAEDTIESNPFRQSTPEAPEIHSILARMVRSGKHYAVVEATSHGLSARTARLRDVRFRGAVATNVTHEHLEFHGTFENYRSDKANLFRAVGNSSRAFGVANLDDPSCGYFRDACGARVLTYSLERDDADLRAMITSATLSGTEFRLVWGGEESSNATLRIPATFNVENFMAAALAAYSLVSVDHPGRIASPLALAPLAERLEGVKGRMTSVGCGQPFHVLVDYAHTPGSFSRFFPLIRKYSPGKLIAVFGSAGERDTEKRPEQGRIASLYADRIFLTDEDPRGDDRMGILREIAAGVTDSFPRTALHLVPDRREAIADAFASAEPGDAVVLLGKGHESSIIYADGPIPWDEKTVACDVLRNMGFRDSPG